MIEEKRRRHSSFGVRAGVAAALALLACGEEGITPDCPPLTLYDVRVVYGPLPEPGPDATPEEIDAIEERREEIEELRRTIEAERAAAVEAGCMTPPGNPPPPAD